jgi:hypothetical protein
LPKSFFLINLIRCLESGFEVIPTRIITFLSERTGSLSILALSEKIVLQFQLYQKGEYKFGHHVAKNMVGL